jgi:hypothetical protein
VSAETIPPGRMPGKYFVIGFVIFGVLLFALALALSINLDPAADRFHNPPAPVKKAN